MGGGTVKTTVFYGSGPRLLKPVDAPTSTIIFLFTGSSPVSLTECLFP